MTGKRGIVVACVALAATGLAGISASALAASGGSAKKPATALARLGGAPSGRAALLAGPDGPASGLLPALTRGPAAAIAAPGGQAHAPVICVNHIPAADPGVVKSPYWIYDDSWATETCIRLHKGVSFRVETNAQARHNEVVAYPAVVYGDYYGYVTPGSNLPVPYRQMGHPHFTVRAGGNAPGIWIADFDSWFYPTANTDSHVRTEVVIIVRHPRYLTMRGGKEVIINHQGWWVREWDTCITKAGKCIWTWPLLRYVLIHPTRHITIPFRAFENIAVHRHLLPRSYWWGSTAFGFENWSGGRGEFVRMRIQRVPLPQR